MLKNRGQGVVSADGQIMGTYLHGLFDRKSALQGLLNWAGLEGIQTFDYETLREEELNRLAYELEKNIDVDTLLKACQKYENN